MNTFTRVMIIVVLVFALVYVGVGAVLFATREQWRGKYNESLAQWEQTESALRGNIKALEQESGRLSGQLATKTSDVLSLEERLVKLEAENKSLLAQNQSLGNDYQNLRDSMDKLRERAESDFKLVMDFKLSLEKTSADLATMTKERNQLAEERTRLEGDLAKLTAQFEDAKKVLAQTKKERDNLSEVVAILKQRGLAVDEVAGLVEMPPIRGSVVSVDENLGIVLINVGTEAGVKKGYEFTVSRGSDYVAKIMIDDVFDKAAAGRLMEGFSKQPVKIGDRVDTRVY